ncbi:MAG: hypothetical protein Kow0092_08330 [Deferrisomatales bacterium]
MDPQALVAQQFVAHADHGDPSHGCPPLRLPGKTPRVQADRSANGLEPAVALIAAPPPNLPPSHRPTVPTSQRPNIPTSQRPNVPTSYPPSPHRVPLTPAPPSR